MSSQQASLGADVFAPARRPAGLARLLVVALKARVLSIRSCRPVGDVGKLEMR